jgi:hypothetical protein
MAASAVGVLPLEVHGGIEECAPRDLYRHTLMLPAILPPLARRSEMIRFRIPCADALARDGVRRLLECLFGCKRA